MKNVYIVIVFLFSCFIFSQNKTITPKTANIIFEKKSEIVNNEEYLSSQKELKKSMIPALKESIIVERLMNGKKTDSVQLNIIVKLLDDNFDKMVALEMNDVNEKTKFHLELKDNLVHKFYSRDGYAGNEKITNLKTGLVEDAEYGNNIGSEIEILTIQEFPDETKTINNYKCFKVIISYKERNEEDSFSNFMHNYMQYRTLWVTNKIKFLYHPVLRNKEILEKYYPLEITEYSDAVKEFITDYKLEELKLN